MELVLIRHAQPVRVDAGSVDGPADPGLSRLGHEQAARLAEWLAPEAPAVVCTSPLRRARETVAPLAAKLGVTAEVVPGVSEYDATSGEYIPIEELRAAKDERWWDDAGGVDPRAFQRQVVPAVDALIDRSAGQRVVVVTHGGVLNVYLAHVLGIEQLLWFHPDYTSISRVLASRHGPRSVATVNETAHLCGRRDPTEASP